MMKTVLLVLLFYVTTASAFEPNSDDLYKRLNLTHKATPTEIKTAYHKAAMAYHPDRNSGNPNAEEMFKKIGEAYTILSNPSSKEKYDLSLSGSGQSFSVETPASHSQDLEIKRKLREDLMKLARENSFISEYVLKVLNYDVGITETNFRVIPPVPLLFPSDRKLLDALLATGHPNLIRNVANSLLTFFPLWSDGLQLLNQIIDLDIKLVNEYIATMVVHPDLINQSGAHILSRMIYLGYVRGATRSLALGGFLDRQVGEKKTWINHPQGLELLYKALLNATPEDRKFIDQLIFTPDGSNWSDKLMTLESLAEEPYLSVERVLRRGIGDNSKGSPKKCSKVAAGALVIRDR